MRQPVHFPLLITSVAAVTVFAIIGFRKSPQLPKPSNEEITRFKNGSGYSWTRLTKSAAFDKSYNFQLFANDSLLWAFHPKGNYYTKDGRDWIKSDLGNSILNLAFMDYIVYKDAVYGLGQFEGNIEHYTINSTITRSRDFKHWDTLAKTSQLPRRFFYHPVVFRDKIWIFGGADSADHNLDDAWTSTDAVHWQKVAEHLPFGPGAGQQFVVFNGKLFRLDNDVWVSTDGLRWEKLTDHITPDVKLFGFTAVVFDGKIWLIGCNRNGQFASQVYNSDDGINWKEQTAPWTPRGGMAAAVFNNKVYVTGGKYGGLKNGQTEFVYSNDVWLMEKE